MSSIDSSFLQAGKAFMSILCCVNTLMKSSLASAEKVSFTIRLIIKVNLDSFVLLKPKKGCGTRLVNGNF